MTTLLVLYLTCIYPGTCTPEFGWAKKVESPEFCAAYSKIVEGQQRRARAFCLAGEVDQEMLNILLGRPGKGCVGSGNRTPDGGNE
jgi:hypothetical protein